MSEIVVETTAGQPHPGFRQPTADLLHFLSFAAAERYGSLHQLSALANRLRRERRIDIRPFWEFDDANPADEQDREQLERLWQDAGPLANAATASAEAIGADAGLAALAVGFPALVPGLEDLASIARWAGARGARVRLTYRLA